MKEEDFSVGVTNNSHDVKYLRERSEYLDLSKKFKLAKKEFNKQFFHIYSVRLKSMKNTVISKAQDVWGTKFPVRKLSELQECEKCVIVGTLFKLQELKPSILKEISEEFQLVPQQKLTNFVSDKDEVILEDELQRVRLIGKINVPSIVTGIVCGVLGLEDDSGKFHVEDICWCGPISIPKPLKSLPENKYLILVSGLDLAHSADSLLPLRLLVDWVSGWLGEPSEQETISKITHVIIAGNIIRGRSQSKEGKIVNTSINTSTDIVSTVKLADDLLEELTDCVEVDLMPGEFDPTNYMLPQQPIHHCMFPKAWRRSTLHLVTNPYSVSVHGRVIVGSSGQPINDICCYTNIGDPLEALSSTLKWGHLAPTAPDTLGCYPYYDEDPFIIDTQPDILFAGNQGKFQTKELEINYGSKGTYKTTLLCIPKFSETGVCAVINLSNLVCTPLSFKVLNEPMDIE